MTMASVMGGSSGRADATASAPSSGVVQKHVGDPGADGVKEDVLEQRFHSFSVWPIWPGKVGEHSGTIVLTLKFSQLQ